MMTGDSQVEKLKILMYLEKAPNGELIRSLDTMGKVPPPILKFYGKQVISHGSDMMK